MDLLEWLVKAAAVGLIVTYNVGLLSGNVTDTLKVIVALSTGGTATDGDTA